MLHNKPYLVKREEELKDYIKAMVSLSFFSSALFALGLVIIFLVEFTALGILISTMGAVGFFVAISTGAIAALEKNSISRTLRK